MKGSRGGIPLYNRTLRDERGITLIEVVIAAVILSFVATGLALFAPKAMEAITRVHTRSVAGHMATTKLQEIASRPYAVIPVTPNNPGNTYFVNSPAGPCDCNAADFTQYVPGADAYTKSDSLTVGGIV